MGPRIRWILAVMAACLLAAGCGGSGGGTTLRIAGNSNASVLPLWVAMDKGMLEKHHIEVDFTKIENIATLPPALGKSFDIVFSTPTLAIASTAQGIPVTQVSGASVDTAANPTNFLMTMKDSGIHDVSDLGGKTVGVLNESGTLHTATLYWLQKNGVDPDSIDVVQVDGPSQADQLKSGRVDAVETVSPFNGQVEAAGGVNLGRPYDSMAPQIAPIYWAARRDWAEDNPKTVKEFKAALGEAQAWIAKHDSQARKILQKYTGFPDEVVQSIQLPSYSTAVRPQDVPLWMNAMRKVSGFKGSVDQKKLVFNP